MNNVIANRFFGDNFDIAMHSLEFLGLNNKFYDICEDELCRGFDACISTILEYKPYEEASDVFSRATRRGLICFEYDFVDATAEMKKYISLCNAKIENTEKVYMFVDTTSFATRKEGFIITSKGLYPSFTYGGAFSKTNEPILFSDIWKIGYRTPYQVYIVKGNKEIANFKMSTDKKFGEFLQFAWVYFKYGAVI